MRIAAGRMRYKVTVETPSESRDSRGGVILSWSTLATVWAKVYENRSGESTTTDQTQANRTIDVEIRRLAGLTHRCRIIHGGRTLNIAAITNSEERGKGHMITCVEAAP